MRPQHYIIGMETLTSGNGSANVVKLFVLFKCVVVCYNYTVQYALKFKGSNDIANC